jgi:hypothetical protein
LQLSVLGDATQIFRWQEGTMARDRIDLASISWIDKKGLPKVGFWFVAGAAISWSRRVIMGLVGTANPEPPTSLKAVEDFQKTQQYRALLAGTFIVGPPPRVTTPILDAGFTPPFDKTTIPAIERKAVPIPDDKTFYAGELSPVSSIVIGRLHPSSTLSIPRGSDVKMSALIKFRAGEHTDALGISKDVKSPVHVPWVWCEYALAWSAARYILICNGSVFPSHAWYVNGQQVGKSLQTEVHASDSDPVLNTGQAASKLRDLAIVDKGSGAVSSQLYAVDAGEQQVIDLGTLSR